MWLLKTQQATLQIMLKLPTMELHKLVLQIKIISSLLTFCATLTLSSTTQLDNRFQELVDVIQSYHSTHQLDVAIHTLLFSNGSKRMNGLCSDCSLVLDSLCVSLEESFTSQSSSWLV